MNSRFKTYQDVESYLNQLPMFVKSPSTAIRFALEPMLKFLEAMGNPHMDFRSIHVAGTNGKGTVCRLLASIYQQAGYKTGLYTSPQDRKSTRLNSSHVAISYAVFCLKKKKITEKAQLTNDLRV